MIISIPENNIAERMYIIDVIMGNFLGLSYSIQVKKTLNYHIKFESKEIIIEDHFFNQYPKNLSYLNEKAIPETVEFGFNQFIVENDIPILYGNNQTKIKNKQIICGIDIFASSFFMLTRWEEYIKKNRDSHNRFPAIYSLAYKFNFLERPVVNEYVEMLWNMLIHLDYNKSRRKKDFELILTHDVDYLRYYTDIKSVVKKIVGDIIKRKKFNTLYSRAKEYYDIKRRKIKDPYDTFDWLMDLSDKVNVKSRFYFMSDDLKDYDNRYDINGELAQEIIKNIQQRGHVVGFHPGIQTYDNQKKWMKEKAQLDNVVKYKINEGRQHYLKFEVPFTYRIWENAGMKMDCSIGYHDKEGFRCGVCYEFPVFDFLKQEKMKLLEYPLIVMEATMHGYQTYSKEKMFITTMDLINKVKKYQGNFVFLWHNSSFNISRWEKYNSVYEKILKNSDG